MSALTAYHIAVLALGPGAIGGGCPGVGLPEAWQVEQRDALQAVYGWPIITTTAADRIAAFIGDRAAIDFGAGSGYLASLLSERGVEVIAIDDFSWGPPAWAWQLVIEGDLRDLRDTADRVLILSWPPRETGMATAALHAWRGDRLVYIGERLRGSAERSFFEALASDWSLVETVAIPQWHNRSDAVYLFERGAGVGLDWATAEIDRCREAH